MPQHTTGFTGLPYTPTLTDLHFINSDQHFLLVIYPFVKETLSGEGNRENRKKNLVNKNGIKKEGRKKKEQIYSE